jgi:RimJ/RimL family protein N-acetyltransferase
MLNAGQIMSSTELCTRHNSVSITIRPIRLTNTEMEAGFMRNLSAESKHFRFLGGVKELSTQKLKQFCDVDRHYSMAFVATVEENGEEKQIGVSRYAPNANQDLREMAVTVADAWQHQGIDVLLTDKLMEFVKGHGIKRLYSIDLVDNTAMRKLAKDIGMQAQRDPEDAHRIIYSLAL